MFSFVNLFNHFGLLFNKDYGTVSVSTIYFDSSFNFFVISNTFTCDAFHSFLFFFYLVLKFFDFICIYNFFTKQSFINEINSY